MHPSEISLAPEAIGGNLLLALVFALVIAITGLVLGSLHQTDPARLRQVLGRLPLQALITFLLIWLFHRIVPNASAQGFAAADVSLLRIPLYAFLFFLVIGVSNTMFNTMLVAEGDRLRSFFSARESGTDLRRKSWFIVLLILLYGVIGGYINPEFNLLPSREIGIVIVTTVTVILSAYLKDLFSFFLARKWRYPRWFEANLAGLVIAIACVALSRTLALNPGYIYGIPVGLLIASRLDRRREGMFEFLGLLWLLIVALAVWVLGPLVAGYPVPEDLFNILYVTLIESVFIELLPLPYFAGAAVFRWKRLLWFSQFTLVVFLLFHTLFNPQGTVASIEQAPPAFAALLLLGCYVVGVFVVWGCVVWARGRDAR